MSLAITAEDDKFHGDPKIWKKWGKEKPKDWQSLQIPKNGKQALWVSARCLLRPAEDNAAVAATLAEGTALRVVVLDPLAPEAPAGEDGFDRFLQQFAGTIAGCLRSTSAETSP